MAEDYQETIIRIDHRAKTAEIWTMRPAVKNRALRAGFAETKRQGKGVWLSGPLSGVSIRKPPRTRDHSANLGRFKGRQE